MRLEKEPLQADGAYTRQQGLKRTYQYSVMWGETKEGAWWQAIVRCDGVTKGTSSGRLGPQLVLTQDAATSLAELSIEYLVGVRE